MKFIKLLTIIIALSSVMLVGCKKDLKSYPNANGLQSSTNSLGTPSTELSPLLDSELAAIAKSLPVGYEKRLEPLTGVFALQHSQNRDLILRQLQLIQPSSCNSNTLLQQWMSGQQSDWTSFMREAVVFPYTGMVDFPTNDALLFQNSSSGQSFGVNGEYTQPVNKTFKDLKRFWDIQSDAIVLAAIHGSMLQDRARLIRIDRILYPWDSQQVAEYYADVILKLLKDFPQYRNGNHPFFTFNSESSPSFDYPPYGTIPAKILLGDGILDALSGIGYGDVAPQAILAHEYGHQVQFQLGLNTNVTTPEASRRKEMMADAFSAYYLSHSRGASMQWKRVKEFLQVFFNIGDCSFYSSDHHGTPTQRMAAAEWAYNVVESAPNQGHILTSRQFSALFDAQLPELLTH